MLILIGHLQTNIIKRQWLWLLSSLIIIIIIMIMSGINNMCLSVKPIYGACFIHRGSLIQLALVSARKGNGISVTCELIELNIHKCWLFNPTMAWKSRRGQYPLSTPEQLGISHQWRLIARQININNRQDNDSSVCIYSGTLRALHYVKPL